MKDKLKDLLDNAYAPYSNYHVACILVTNDLKEITGVNVEVASFGGTICAERNAITTAIAKGYQKGDFKEIHIMNKTNETCTPCMICRQSFLEFFDMDMKVYSYSYNGDEKEYTVKELCPFPFAKEDLE